MKRQADDKAKDRQRRNMQFLDERLELLDTIHKMIDTEFEKRAVERMIMKQRRSLTLHTRKCARNCLLNG